MSQERFGIAEAESRVNQNRLVRTGAALTCLVLTATLNPYTTSEVSSQQEIHEATYESETGMTLYESMEAVCVDGERPQLHHAVQPSEFMYHDVIQVTESGDIPYQSGSLAPVKVTSMSPWSNFRVGNRSVTIYNTGEFEDGSTIQGDPITMEYPCDDPDPEPTQPPSTGGPEDPMTSTSLGLSDDPARVATEVSQNAFIESDTAVLGTTITFADALAAVPLAAQQEAPILLTDQPALSPATRTELERLGVTRVIIVGGIAAVSDAVVNELSALGIEVQRISGSDRTETAVEIARTMQTYAQDNGLADSDASYIVNGENFPDALSAGAIAGRNGNPVLLVRSGDLPSATADFLANNDVESIVVIGGEVVVPEAIVEEIADTTQLDMLDFTRLAGPERVETSRAAAQTDLAVQGVYLERLYLTRADHWFGAIATSAVVAQESGSSMLLAYNFEGSAPQGVTTPLETFLEQNKVATENQTISDEIVFVGNFSGDASGHYSTIASGTPARIVSD